MIPGMATKMTERMATRQATKSHPDFAKMLSGMRMAGSPMPSMAQLLGFGMADGNKRKATPDKTGMGMGMAAGAAQAAPKMPAMAGRKFTMKDLMGLR